MINASDFRNGVTFEMDNGVWTIVEFLHVKPGKGAAFVRTKLKNVYDIVLKAQLAGIAAARAGVLGRDIDGAAREVIADAGYGPYFGHGFGHCLGLDIHEWPIAGPPGNVPMPAGCLSSAEPGIYLPGKFGVRIEDVMIIRENGAEVITKAPKTELIVL